MDRRGLIAWAFYDWANSAFTTVVVTFIFANYFIGAVAVDEITGISQWAFAMSASGLAVAVLAPIIGAIADKGGRRKPWLGTFTAAAVVLTAALWFVEPDSSFIVFALVIAATANLTFEMGIVFNNAMLPDIAPRDKIGRVSGWAWGLGYLGGLICLAIILAGFDTGSTDQIRATSILVAVWFGLFSIPLFLWTPDTPSTGLPWRDAVGQGLSMLGTTIRQVRTYGNIARFLVARLIYNDGLVTLFAMGGVFAKVTFGMSLEDVIMFGLLINVAAGVGAVAFAWIDDRVGSKTTILLSLAGLTALGIVVLLVETKSMFLIFGSLLGIFVGPVQAASRSMMARLVPHGMETEMFGLFAFSGKATAFLGPLAFGAVTAAFANQRAGMATIFIFFIVGGGLLLTVAQPRLRA